MDKKYWLMLFASWGLMSVVCTTESITGSCDVALLEFHRDDSFIGFRLRLFRFHFLQTG